MDITIYNENLKKTISKKEARKLLHRLYDVLKRYRKRDAEAIVDIDLGKEAICI